ncbi:unnamed protein product [Caenorhabditis auriculariae]|uniref:Branchpoint-bridging protein n=1 Tax=Caenorhabditis auriculariae TaxID=2777116 RepID=A0A8S1HNN1_9PELO|nr:unnamed protein product [Caenorhabditis auriculariae]
MGWHEHFRRHCGRTYTPAEHVGCEIKVEVAVQKQVPRSQEGQEEKVAFARQTVQIPRQGTSSAIQIQRQTAKSLQGSEKKSNNGPISSARHQGTGYQPANSSGSCSSGAGSDGPICRWSTTKSFVPGMPTILPSDLTEEQRTAYLLQLEIEDATRKLRLGDFIGSSDPAERSPSPEPIYDANGKRLNTRDVRKRQELEQLRHEKIQALLRINPNFKPPADYRAPNIRLHDKVWIPQDEHPELNFVGLLIGPRGNTLKSLEAETGAKIIIRGKGSVKEGKLANRMGPMPGENEPLHAYVTGTDQATIKRACDRIRSIIAAATEIPDGQNELRKLQLRELALLNGTLRPEDLVNGARCSNCGSDEHKTWECPDAPNVTGQIKCNICGAFGHISRDCKNPQMAGDASYMQAGMDDEYAALMDELGEKSVRPSAPSTADRGASMRGRAGFGYRGGARGGASFLPSMIFGDQQPPEPHYGGATIQSATNAFAAASAQAYSTDYSAQDPYAAHYQHYSQQQQQQQYGAQPPYNFFASPGARGGRGRGAWYGSGGSTTMPLPVPPPPPAPLGGFVPPPPPPPPMPHNDLARLLSAPAPPPPPPPPS